MDIISKDLSNNLIALSENLKDKLLRIEGLDKISIRNNLKNFGKFVKLEKKDAKFLNLYKPMACIDGSVNRYGGSHPHYIDIFQGLSKISGDEMHSHFKSDLYSPILNPPTEEDEDLRNKLLARIEIEVALETLERQEVKMILMDGNLIRYSIRDADNYQILKNACEEKGVILAGFIKEVKSDSIFKLIYPNSVGFNLYDKDLLYGILENGEGFLFHDVHNKKLEEGISSMFLRTSNYPGIAGLEILNTQSEFLIDIGNLCYSLTSSMSRGVPMIIDMVDKEVKLDDNLTRELINSYVDKDVVERFFVSERSLRRY